MVFFIIITVSEEIQRELNLVLETFKEIFPGYDEEKVLNALGKSFSFPDSVKELASFVYYSHEKEKRVKLLIENDKVLEIVVIVFSISRYLTSIIRNNSEYLMYTAENIQNKISLENLEKEFSDFKGDRSGKNELLRYLKKIKAREFLKIAVREILGYSTFEEAVAEYSDLADFVVQKVFEICFEELCKDYGEPSSAFCVVGLGKLGGRELNYSSDIDIIFAYRDDGETSKGETNKAFYTKLSKEIILALVDKYDGDFLFRVDARLRPLGEFGEIVRSEKSYYEYYEDNAMTWERQMLIKARVVGGNREFGERFVRRLKEIAFSTYLTTDEISDILNVKSKIKGAENDVKRFTGGIRDIEFIVQTFQLLFGVQNEELWTSNTLEAIDLLHKTGVFDRFTSNILRESYIFFRRLENYLQLYENLQTFSIPTDNTTRLNILYRMLSRDPSLKEDKSKEFLLTVKNYRKNVINVKEYVFLNVLQIEKGEELIFFIYNNDEEEIRDILSSYGFRDVDKSYSVISDFLKQSKLGGIDVSLSLRNLLRSVSRNPDPDKSLINIYHILEASQNILISIPFFRDGRNVNFVSKISNLRDMFINALRKRNWIFDGMMDIKAFFDYFEILKEGLTFDANFLAKLEELYIVLETALAFLEINHFISTIEVRQRITDFFDSVFTKILEKYPEVYIWKLGRWATRELTFFSDLDMIILIDEPKGSETWFRIKDELSKLLRRLNDIFEIDLRLVEGGSKGSPYISLQSFEEGKFEPWQIVAYLKSDILGLNTEKIKSIKNILSKKIIESIKENTVEEIEKLRKKVVSYFKSSTEDFSIFIKKGEFGLLDLEFRFDKKILGEKLYAEFLPLGISTKGIIEKFFASECEYIQKYIDSLLVLEDFSKILEKPSRENVFKFSLIDDIKFNHLYERVCDFFSEEEKAFRE